jgi:hypothetical protein
MLLSNVLPLLCLFGSTFSAPIDLATQAVPAESYFPRLINVLSRMDNALKTIPGGGSLSEAAGRTNDLLNMQVEYVNILRDGANAVRRGQNMLPTDGMRMISSIQQVGKLLSSTSAGWVQARDMVTAAQKRNDVYQELIIASDATGLFGDAFVGKMPIPAQTMGKSFSKSCTTSLENAVRAYRN